MQRFLFFLLPAAMLISCKQHRGDEKHAEEKAAKDTVIKRTWDYNDTVHLPYRTEEDSGYFKGYISVPFKEEKSTQKDDRLHQFMTDNFSRKDIHILNKYSLSESVMIDQKKELRTDSFRLADILIVSRYCFKAKETQDIIINGRTALHIKNDADPKSSDNADILQLNPFSFRHFSFKGKEFYFISANILECGGSVCPTDYFLLYDLTHKQLSEFSSYRVYENLFFGDADGDDQLDFLSVENEGGYGQPGNNWFKATLYSCNNKTGIFEIKKDKAGREYFIEGHTGDDPYVAQKMNIEKSNWPVKMITKN